MIIYQQMSRTISWSQKIIKYFCNNLNNQQNFDVMIFLRRNWKIYIAGVTRTNFPSLITNQRRDRAIGKQQQETSAVTAQPWRNSSGDALLRRGVEKTISRLYAASWRCIRFYARSLREKTRARECSHTFSHICALSYTRFTNLTFTRRLVGSSSHVTLAASSERAANIVQRRDGFYFRIVVVSLFCLPLVSPARVADTLVNSTRTISFNVLERFNDFLMMGSTYLACETTPTWVANGTQIIL